MGQVQLADVALIANNEVVGVDPNSIAFRDGFGERKVRSVSVGDGKVEPIYSRDLESALGTLKFTLPTTIDNVALLRAWLANDNLNVFQLAGTTPDGKQFARTFTQAAVVNNPEVGIGTETSIEIEIMSNPAI